MEFYQIFIIAVSLAMDAFAVSVGAASSGQLKGKRGTFRLSFHFGLFQFFMPIIGWFLGSSINQYVAYIDHWIAFSLLLFVGIKMITSALRQNSETFSYDPSRGLSLVLLSLATSMDALAIGLSFAMLSLNIWYPSVIIGIVASGFSLIGIKMGRRLGKMFGKRMEILGGLILIVISFRILLSHLLA